MSPFTYAPAEFIPFRDMETIERVRAIRAEDIANHPNPDFQIRAMPGTQIGFTWLTDMFYRIKMAADSGEKVVLITPQPWPEGYAQLAYLINKFRVNCEKLYTFNMDEYANEHGNIAPETWPKACGELAGTW